jgi:hypothetical protein
MHPRQKTDILDKNHVCEKYGPTKQNSNVCHFFIGGVDFMTVKQVTEYHCYTKEMALANGQPALVKVGIGQVREKQLTDPGWRTSLAINLNLVDKGLEGSVADQNPKLMAGSESE